MSDVSDQIEASIALGDFVNIDSSGKANLIGSGLRIFRIDPNSGATSPFGILVTLSSPMALGDSPAFEILLTTATGSVVQLPVPGGSQALRISQNIDFAEPSAPQGFSIPKGAVPSTVQFAINFSGGLPLDEGNSYQFRAQIDHDVVASYSFYVVKPPPGPLVG